METNNARGLRRRWGGGLIGLVDERIEAVQRIIRGQEAARVGGPFFEEMTCWQSLPRVAARVLQSSQNQSRFHQFQALDFAQGGQSVDVGQSTGPEAGKGGKSQNRVMERKSSGRRRVLSQADHALWTLGVY